MYKILVAVLHGNLYSHALKIAYKLNKHKIHGNLSCWISCTYAQMRGGRQRKFLVYNNERACMQYLSYKLAPIWSFIRSVFSSKGMTVQLRHY